MPPRIHLVRHAQGYHNLDPVEEQRRIHDPALTEHGVKRCIEFNDTYPGYVHLDLICASPMRRTIQTAQYCFHDRIPTTPSRQVLLLPLAQETTAEPCDVGSDPDAIKQEFGDLVDVGMVPKDWTSKEGIYATTPTALLARARELRRWLRARPEKDIVVVSHGAFLDYMTGALTHDGLLLGNARLSDSLTPRTCSR